MTKKDAGFGPAHRTAEQLAAQAITDRRLAREARFYSKMSQQIIKIADEVINEQLRQLRINPFPTCPHCGNMFKGPATLYADTASQVTMAAADRILRGEPIMTYGPQKDPRRSK